MQEKLLKILGTKYPLIQGGMAWIADASLAAAVSNAGGFGLIAAMNSTGVQLKEEIAKARALTDKPFGVNIMLMSPNCDEVAKTVIDEGIEIVTTGAGNPARYMPSWIEAGIKVIPVVPSVAIAKSVEKKGASAVVAEGHEAGGHIGEITTMALIPQVVDAVSIPVIAAGGIADGRQLAAALMLGAAGVQIGTRLLVANECTISDEYKNTVLRARDISTITTGKKLGHLVRALKTPFVRELIDIENRPDITIEELEKSGAGALRLAARFGDLEKGWFMAGQVAGMVNKCQSAAEIVSEMFTQAKTILKSAPKVIKW